MHTSSVAVFQMTRQRRYLDTSHKARSCFIYASTQKQSEYVTRSFYVQMLKIIPIIEISPISKRSILLVKHLRFIQKRRPSLELSAAGATS